MKLSVFPSSIETSRALILRLVEIMNEEPDRVFNIAVSGGNTPALMFDLWANEYMEITPWDRMRIYWVDERCVPPDDSDPIQNARYVIFLITGKNKVDVVEEICNSGDTGPAAYIAHHAQNVELFVDKAAAAYIDDSNKKMN